MPTPQLREIKFDFKTRFAETFFFSFFNKRCNSNTCKFQRLCQNEIELTLFHNEINYKNPYAAIF